MADLCRDTIFLVLWPDPKYGRGQWRYTSDDFQTDNIHLVPWPYDTAMQSGVLGFDPVRFYEIDTYLAPTTYWFQQVESGVHFLGGYKKTWAMASRPTLIAQHMYIIHRSLPYVYETNFGRQWLQIGGSIAADRVVFNSDHCQTMAREAFSEYLTPDQMKRIEDKSDVLKFGFVSGDEPETRPATDDDRPVFLYNHRFESYKNPDKTFQLFDELRKAGRNFEVHVTQVAGQASGGRRKYHFDKIVFEPVKTDYMSRIAETPSINTINSQHETFCISLMDSISVGHLVVAPDSVTFPELVPDGYPYLFKNQNEQRAMIASILDKWPTPYNEWRERLIKHARQKFGIAEYTREYIGLMTRAEAEHRKGEMKPRTRETLIKLFDGMTKGQPYHVMRMGQLRSKVSDGRMGDQAMPNRRLIREALTWRDDIRLTWNNGVRLTRE
jgi:glycosyltransferase involved in cell wall biosynthesis